MTEFERKLSESQTWVSVVVRLKTIKSREDIFCYLSFYLCSSESPLLCSHSAPHHYHHYLKSLISSKVIESLSHQALEPLRRALRYRVVIMIIIECNQTGLCQPLPRWSLSLLAMMTTTIIQAINFTHVRGVDYSSGCRKRTLSIASSKNTRPSCHWVSPTLTHSGQLEADVLLLQITQPCCVQRFEHLVNKTSRSVTQEQEHSFSKGSHRYPVWRQITGRS